MMNSGSMAEKIMAMMEQKEKAGKDSFTISGDKASPVMMEEDREYVMYESPNGEQIKIYGNWNEYADRRDEQGRDMIKIEETYPITKNAEGEFIFDEAAFENMMMERSQEMEEEEMPEEEEGMMKMMMGGKLPPEYKYGGKMQYMGGGRMDYKRGGKFPDLTGDGEVTMADILKGRGVIK